VRIFSDCYIRGKKRPGEKTRGRTWDTGGEVQKAFRLRNLASLGTRDRKGFATSLRARKARKKALREAEKLDKCGPRLRKRDETRVANAYGTIGWYRGRKGPR